MFTEDAFGLISGDSPFRELVKEVKRAAHARGGVLVCGEPGTGHSIIARAIHAYRFGSCAPFIPADCSINDGAELEHRLFGGPGIGETQRACRRTCERIYPGSLLHDALGGTIYFRNLEELPARTQSRLAQLLRDRECQVESRGPSVPYDVLAITAVDSTVDDVTADGRIRVDLFRRFSVNRLVVLPLRDCRSEIPMFAGLLLERACQAIGITPKTLEPAAVSILAAMPWRGNARELMSLIETLVIKVPGKVITLDALLDSARLDGTPGVNWNLGASLREARQHFEREYIAAVVAQFRGRVPDAARSLGIQRTNLYRKLRCLHIKADREGGPGGPRKGGD